jgi:hypothetical protein
MALCGVTRWQPDNAYVSGVRGLECDPDDLMIVAAHRPVGHA